MYNILGVIGIGSILILLLGGVIVFACYVLSCLSIMRMAGNAGIEEKWLAWIPVGNLYIIGKLIQKIEFGGKTYEQAELILPGAFVLTLVLRGVGALSSLGNFLMWLVTMYSLFLLIKQYVPDKVTKYMTISIFVPIIGPCLVLSKIKDSKPMDARDSMDRCDPIQNMR